jgi:hypothetical protein
MLSIATPALSASAPAPRTVLLDTSGRVIARTSDAFVGVGLDLWKSSDPTYGEKWGNNSALHIQLSDRLQKLVTALAPAVIRIGGSPQDSLVYEAISGSCSSPPPSSSLGSAHLTAAAPEATPEENYYCSQVRPANYDCLTNERWQDIGAFASATGSRLVFGLNGCLGRASRDAPIDLAGLRTFFVETRRRRILPWGFELGNELNGGYSGSQGVAPRQLARDLVRVSETLLSVWASEHPSRRPKLLAPDIAAFTGGVELPPYLEEVLTSLPPPTSATLHAITYHQCAPHSLAGARPPCTTSPKVATFGVLSYC